MRKITAGACALLLVGSLAACSGSGSDASPSTTTKAPAAGTTATTADGGGDEVTTTAGADGGETTTTDGGSAPAGGTAIEYATQLAKGLSAGEKGSDELQVSAAQARCVAPKWVEAMGVDALTSSGTSPKDLADPDFDFPGLKLEPAQGLAMVDAFADCDVDIYVQFYAVLSKGLDATQKACLQGELDQATARQFLAESLTTADISAQLGTTLGTIEKACKLSAG